MEKNKLPNKQIFMPTWLSLPSAWDESVSNVEMLQGILYNVNCIIQYLEDLQTNYEAYTDNAVNNLRVELTNKYDGIIADLKEYYNNAIVDLYAYIDTQDIKYWTDTLAQVVRLDKRIDDLLNYVNENFSDIRTKHATDISNVYKYIESTRQDIMSFIELNNQALKEWVEDTYQEILDKVDEINEDGFRIYDPTTGFKDRVETVVNNVYNALRVFGITAQEWDNWFIKDKHTGLDFRRLNMSALEFDTKSWLLMYGFKMDNVISPVTGLETTVQYALEEVSTNSVADTPETGNLTCSQWDALDFDQNDYEVNYVMSAYEHDFKSAHIFDNDYIKTIGFNNGYIREYTIGVPNMEDRFTLLFDGEEILKKQLFFADIVSVLPEDVTSFSTSSITHNVNGNYLESLVFIINNNTPDTEIQELYVRIILTNQDLNPVNISNTNPPKPIPLGVVTADEFDNWMDAHNGGEFKLLDLSAYEYDTNSIKFLV